MLNWIWFGMMVFSVLAALLLGRMQSVSEGILDAAKFTINFLLPQAGFMAVWMGIMRLVEKSGMIVTISRALSPLLRLLFPSVPAGHPALGAIALNLGAGMLGAGNATTPAGIKAMRHLQSLNPNKHVATNEMCMLLALTTCVVTLIPASTVRALHEVGSTRSTQVILPSFLTTLCASIIAVIACKFFQRFTVHQPQPDDAERNAEVEKQLETAKETEIPVAPVPLSPARSILLWSFFGLALITGVLYVVNPEWLRDWQAGRLGELNSKKSLDAAMYNPIPATGFSRLAAFIGAAAIPLFMAYFVLHAALAKVKVFEEFVEGAKDGFQIILRIIPYVAGILVGVRMMRESGLMELIETGLKPLLGLVGFPVALVPMALIRPLSGGAAQGVLADMARPGAYGPDSYETMVAATINGSADTTFYIIAVYFGSAGVKKLRHAIAAGLTADFAAIVFAVIIGAIFFG